MLVFKVGLLHGGPVEYVECRHGSLVFYRQVDNSDKVRSVSRVAIPNPCGAEFRFCFILLVALRHLLLKLCYQAFVGGRFVCIVGAAEGGFRHSALYVVVGFACLRYLFNRLFCAFRHRLNGFFFCRFLRYFLAGLGRFAFGGRLNGFSRSLFCRFVVFFWCRYCRQVIEKRSRF